MGLGIHGEPGAYKSSLKPAGKIVEEIVRQITSQETSYLQVREGMGSICLNGGRCGVLTHRERGGVELDGWVASLRQIIGERCGMGLWEVGSCLMHGQARAS